MIVAVRVPRYPRESEEGRHIHTRTRTRDLHCYDPRSDENPPSVRSSVCRLLLDNARTGPYDNADCVSGGTG